MRAKRSALLVDFDNLAARHSMPLVDNVGNWLSWLEDGGFDPRGQKRAFVRKRVYWNIDKDDAHRLPFRRRLFETRVCRAVRNKDKASSADFDITIDAVELRHDFRNIEEVIILSYDSDFLTVLNHLQMFEIDVVGMARGKERPAVAYRELADFAIEYEDFKAAFSYERPKRTLLGALAPKKSKPAPKPAPPPAPMSSNAAPPTRRPPRAKRVYDLKGAAAVVAKAATASPSARLSKKFVTKALTGFEGFSTIGAAWLGCGDYHSMIRELAALHSRLDLETTSTGGLFLVYKGPQAAAA